MTPNKPNKPNVALLKKVLAKIEEVEAKKWIFNWIVPLPILFGCAIAFVICWLFCE